MTEAKLRVKIGEHEFDATGPAETVEQYFQSFKQLISGSSALASAKEPKTTPFHKLVQLNGRTAFLKVAPKPEEAAEGLNRRGVAYLSMNKYDEGIKDLTDYLAKKPEFGGWVNEADSQNVTKIGNAEPSLPKGFQGFKRPTFKMPTFKKG